MSKQVLLINDMCGYGKVALPAMIPVLSHMGVNLYNLPTALVSNTLDYGKFDILDTTQYMQNTLKVWQELGFSFDAIATGLIVNEKQAEVIANYCIEKSQNGVTVIVDPIMADNGKLYNGMTEKTISYMKKLVACADYAVPNYTESCLLAGIDYIDNPTQEDIKFIIDKLRTLGAKSVIVTSVCIDGVHQVCGFDANKQEYFNLPYKYIPVFFPGTGDIFASVFIGNILNNIEMKRSVQKAMNVVYQMISRNVDNQDKYKGILIESCLEVIDNE